MPSRRLAEAEAIQLLCADGKQGKGMTQHSSADSIAGVEETTPEQTEQKAEADVLPEWTNVVLASLWIILFGGRWLLVPFIQMAGVLSPEQLAAWDDGMGQKTYLILLAITLVVLGLRTARNAQKPKALSERS